MSWMFSGTRTCEDVLEGEFDVASIECGRLDK